MHSRATPEQIRAVTELACGRFPGLHHRQPGQLRPAAVCSAYDGPDDRPVAMLEIVMETFQDETTPAEIVGRLDDAGYHGKLVEAGCRPVVYFTPASGPRWRRLVPSHGDR